MTTKIKAPVIGLTKYPDPINFANHLIRNGAEKLYALDCLGQGWNVGAIDSGRADHIQWVDSTPHQVIRSFVNSDPNPKSDPNNHGTCIASLLIGGQPSKKNWTCVGLAPKVSNYYHAKVWGEKMIVLDDVIKALDWFINLSGQGIGPDIVNMSFGEYFDQPWADDIQGINQRMARLYDKDKTLFFVAADNSGNTTNKVSWLSELPFTITVGACGFNDYRGYLSPSSPLIDIVADGIGVSGYKNTGSGYEVYDGTSQSTAIAASVSTAIGSYLVNKKGMTKMQVKSNFLNICKTSGYIKDLELPGFDNDTGLGMIKFV